jgi:signal transduction histidine kinase
VSVNYFFFASAFGFTITTMSIRTCLCFLFLWGSHTTMAQHHPSVLRIDGRFAKNTLLGHAAYFSDTSQTVTIEALLSDTANQYDFQLIDKQILNVGFAPWAHWVRCQIRNEADHEQALVFGVDFVYIDDLAFFIVDEQRKVRYRKEHISRRTPIVDRPMAHRMFAFPVVIKPNQTLTLYCRAIREKSVLMLPITLYSQHEFIKYGFSFDLLISLGTGILLIAFLTSLSLFLATKKSLLCYYAIYTVSYGIAFMGMVGIWDHYLPNIPLLGENTHLVMFGIAGFAQLNFTIEFLLLRSLLKRNWINGIKIISLLSLSAAIYVLILPFSFTNSSIIAIVGLVIEILILGLVIFGLTRRKYEALIYLISFLPLLISISWFAITVLFSVDIGWVFYKFGYAIPFVQIIVLGIGIGFKLIREKEESLTAVSTIHQQYAEQLLNAQETERRRIAKDLHDDIGTSLIALRGKLPTNSSDAHNFLDQIIADVRAVSHNLMPDELMTLGLAGAVGEAARRLEDSSGIKFLFISAGETVPLSQIAELTLYRAILELMNNVVRHSQATESVVQLVYHPDLLNITIEDNGRGFSNKNTGSMNGIGLKSVASRTEWLRGLMAVDTSVAGTTIRLEIPYDAHLP